MSSDLPSFMQPSQNAPKQPGFLARTPFPATKFEPNPLTPRGKSPEVKQLIFDRFELAFPRLIDRLYGGETINAILEDFPIPVDRGAFMRWIKSDAQRFAIFTEAKETRTELWTGEMMEIARGKEVNGELIELDRAKFIVDTMKWLIKSENRKGYGDSKQIEMSGSISIVAALEQAQTRVQQVATFTDEDETEPTLKQLTEATDADWEEVDDDD
jgi:hypothetical protein